MSENKLIEKHDIDNKSGLNARMRQPEENAPRPEAPEEEKTALADAAKGGKAVPAEADGNEMTPPAEAAQGAGVTSTPQRRHEHKTRSAKEKKRAAKLAISLVIAFLVLGLINLLASLDLNFSFFSSATDEKPKKPVYLERPDYNENIFEDEVYMDQIRAIRYTEGAQSVLLTQEKDIAAAGAPVMMLIDYFDAIINGDAKTYNTFFTEDYISKNGLHPAFTMQKIYEINVEKLSEYILYEGTSNRLTRYEYRVTYLIMNNNGTFRDDVASGAAIPEIYEILEYDSDGTVKINSITKYKS